MVFIIVGKACTGKTTLRQYLENRGFKCFEASEILKKTCIEYSIESPEEVFDKFSKRYVAEEIFKNIKGSDYAVISGLRTVEEIQYLKSRRNCIVIGLYSSDETCFKRAKTRGRNSDPKEFMDFYSRRICADYALGLAEIMSKYVDILIINEFNDVKGFITYIDNLFCFLI